MSRKIFEGQHEAIIERPLWDRVQQQLVQNRPAKRHRFRQGESGILTGLLFDANGNRYIPSHTTKKERRYSYYVSETKLTFRKQAPAQLPRVPATEIEALALKEMDDLMLSSQRLSEVLCLKEHADIADLVTASESWRAARKHLDNVVHDCVRKVVLNLDDVGITVSRSALRTELGLEHFEYEEDNATFSTTTAIRRVRSELRFQIPGGKPTESRMSESLVRALANAHDWLDRILRGTPFAYLRS